MFALVAVVSLLMAENTTAGNASPNVIFIIADDLGYGDLGCYGQKIIRTPNIDRMAAEGMRLTRHYSGNAVCAPSRCVLMTGKHPGHAFMMRP
jgi:arylsulfatase